MGTIKYIIIWCVSFVCLDAFVLFVDHSGGNTRNKTKKVIEIKPLQTFCQNWHTVIYILLRSSHLVTAQHRASTYIQRNGYIGLKQEHFIVSLRSDSIAWLELKAPIRNLPQINLCAVSIYC